MLLCFLYVSLGMGLSSARKAGDVTVALLVNNFEIPGCRFLSLMIDQESKTFLMFNLR